LVIGGAITPRLGSGVQFASSWWWLRRRRQAGEVSQSTTIEEGDGQNNKYEISAFSLARDIYGLFILEENA